MNGPIYHTATDQRCEQSVAEQLFFERLRNANVPVVPQVKLGNNWVFDGAIDGTNVLVEYHGSYWHERPEVKARDARKLAWADQEGYFIVTVWEDHERRDPDGEVARVRTIYEEVVAHAAREAEAADRSDTPQAIPARVYDDWRDRFLAQLGEGGIVREACIAAGVSRQTAYEARKADVVFAGDWTLALQDAADKALAEYRRRGLNQSDRAMEFFIKSRDPEPYRDVARHEHSGPDGGPIELSAPALEAAARELAEWRQQQTEQLNTLSAPPTRRTPATPTA